MPIYYCCLVSDRTSRLSSNAFHAQSPQRAAEDYVESNYDSLVQDVWHAARLSAFERTPPYQEPELVVRIWVAEGAGDPVAVPVSIRWRPEFRAIDPAAGRLVTRSG